MSVYNKLFEAKKEIGKISKDSKNPFYKSKYFDVNKLLEHIEPIMEKNNLLLLQPIIDNKVKTIIIDINSGEEVSSELALLNIQDPQKIGSAITYYRRYTLQSLLGLQSEDDDGNKASIIKSYKDCKTKEELRIYYKNLDEDARKKLSELITEFSKTLPN